VAVEAGAAAPASDAACLYALLERGGVGGGAPGPMVVAVWELGGAERAATAELPPSATYANCCDLVWAAGSVLLFGGAGAQFALQAELRSAAAAGAGGALELKVELRTVAAVEPPQGNAAAQLGWHVLSALAVGADEAAAARLAFAPMPAVDEAARAGA